MAIAWAAIEHIISTTGAKTLFATHYHELTDLEGILEGVVNYSVGIKELDGSVIFLHKIRRGGADRSFGIEVARLAGLPEPLLERARQLLLALRKDAGVELSKLDTNVSVAQPEENVGLSKIAGTLRALDINSLTPLEALSVLNDMKQRLNG